MKRSAALGAWCVSILLLALLAAGCAKTVVGQAQPAAPGAAQRVNISACSYAFTPNKIEVKAGQPVLVSVTNTSDITHNITVKDPEEQTLVNEDLSPGATQTVTFTPTAPGRYPFYCDKFGHPEMGMTGEFDAVAR